MSISCVDFAHPNMIAGHGFKGGYSVSTGALEHPDIKRFNMFTCALFVPPNPEKTATFVPATPKQESFGDAMMRTFGSQVVNVSNPTCRKMLENFKACFENHRVKGDPESACAFYQHGMQRNSCAAN